MLLRSPIITISTTASLSRPKILLKKPFLQPLQSTSSSPHRSFYTPPKMNLLSKLGFGARSPTEASMDSASSAIAQGPDDDIPAPGQQFAI
ncbi:hypothetical protein Leryth_027096 [Lithospermum erythrorhizon]|nr:hypothetical protein Leryth_027096 [Lithospermum erythrorhizon]